MQRIHCAASRPKPVGRARHGGLWLSIRVGGCRRAEGGQRQQAAKAMRETSIQLRLMPAPSRDPSAELQPENHPGWTFRTRRPRAGWTAGDTRCATCDSVLHSPDRPTACRAHRKSAPSCGPGRADAWRLKAALQAQFGAVACQSASRSGCSGCAYAKEAFRIDTLSVHARWPKGYLDSVAHHGSHC